MCHGRPDRLTKYGSEGTTGTRERIGLMPHIGLVPHEFDAFSIIIDFKKCILATLDKYCTCRYMPYALYYSLECVEV